MLVQGQNLSGTNNVFFKLTIGASIRGSIKRIRPLVNIHRTAIEELRALVHAISHRVVRFLEKRGFLERDAESSYLALEPDDDDVMVQLQGHSITYRIAVGPQQGRKVFTLRTLPPDEDSLGGTPPAGSDRVAKETGFSLHAGVSTEAHQRDKLERLCRYVTRPAVSEKRLAITSNGNIRYQLKTPYRDGTTHVIFERGGLPSLDFVAKLAGAFKVGARVMVPHLACFVTGRDPEREDVSGAITGYTSSTRYAVLLDNGTTKRYIWAHQIRVERKRSLRSK